MRDETTSGEVNNEVEPEDPVQADYNKGKELRGAGDFALRGVRAIRGEEVTIVVHTVGVGAIGRGDRAGDDVDPEHPGQVAGREPDQREGSRPDFG